MRESGTTCICVIGQESDQNKGSSHLLARAGMQVESIHSRTYPHPEETGVGVGGRVGEEEKRS